MIYGVRHVEMGVKQLRGEGGGEGGGGGGGYSSHSYVTNCSNLHIYLHHRICSDRGKCPGCGFVPAEIVVRH